MIRRFLLWLCYTWVPHYHPTERTDIQYWIQRDDREGDRG